MALNQIILGVTNNITKKKTGVHLTLLKSEVFKVCVSGLDYCGLYLTDLLEYSNRSLTTELTEGRPEENHKAGERP